MKTKENKEIKEIRFPVKKLSKEITTIISDKILNQIKYLTSKISKVEWSGILFYSTQGSLDNVDEYIITLETIYPMDKGSSGYTEFDISEDLIGFRMDNPETNKMNMGLIHSHNSMSAFFSGTDMDELNLTSRHHNAYLSIIVNNALDVVGKLGFVAKTNEPVSYNYMGNAGQQHTIRIKNEKQVLFTYDCKIERPGEIVDGEFITLVDKIIDSAAKKASEFRTRFPTNSQTNPMEYGYNINKILGPPTPRQLEIPMSTFENGRFENDNDDLWMQTFPNYWITFGDMDSENKTIDEISNVLIHEIQSGNIQIDNYAVQLITATASIYENYFMSDPNDVLSDIDIIEAMTTVYEYFLETTETDKNLEVVLQYLNKYLTELENQGDTYE